MERNGWKDEREKESFEYIKKKEIMIMMDRIRKEREGESERENVPVRCAASQRVVWCEQMWSIERRGFWYVKAIVKGRPKLGCFVYFIFVCNACVMRG